MVKIIFILLAIVGLIGVYAVVIHTYLAAHAAATAKSATVASTTGFAKVEAVMAGWKTLVCTWAAGLFALVAGIPTDTITAWGTLPWASVIDQKTAALVSIFLSLIAGVFHTQGIAAAAVTPPQTPQPPAS